MRQRCQNGCSIAKINHDHIVPSANITSREKITLTHKIGYKPGTRMVIDILRRSCLFHDSVAHYSYTVGHGHCLLLIVGYTDEGGSQISLQMFELKLHLPAEFNIQRSQRFIKQQNGWLINKGPGECDPLLLPAAELVGHACFVPCKFDKAQRFRHFVPYD